MSKTHRIEGDAAAVIAIAAGVPCQVTSTSRLSEDGRSILVTTTMQTTQRCSVVRDEAGQIVVYVAPTEPKPRDPREAIFD
jgi:hypothetical protein